METKFKVGDIIRYTKFGNSHWDWKIKEIVFEKRRVYELGMGDFENCYIVYNCAKNLHSFVSFVDDDKFSIIASYKDKSITTSTCPQCNGELVEKFSEYVGGNIKKCKLCGWC